ncbi:hypothetical protein F0521_40950 [Ferrimonas sp. YFM]|nr:hypothetical protein F0521_40950 [Ferrimonas sp. YFM]
MPHGKPAGVRCIQLDDNNLCKLFGQPQRPVVCGAFKPDADLCGGTDEQAMATLTLLEQDTYETLRAGAALKG